MNYRPPFWKVSGGSSDAIFGVQIYGGMRGTWWHRSLVMPVYRIGKAVSDAWHEVMYRLHPRHQYHLVRTGLKPGYYDCDILMLHACMALLCRYVEDGMGGAAAIDRFNQQLRLTPDRNAPEGLQERQADRQAEAVEVYRWWKQTKPADEKRLAEMMHHLYGRPRTEETLSGGGKRLVIGGWWGPDEKTMLEEMRDLENKIGDEEQSMLQRLVQIRLSLWT